MSFEYTNVMQGEAFTTFPIQMIEDGCWNAYMTPPMPKLVFCCTTRNGQRKWRWEHGLLKLRLSNGTAGQR
jgi:hypothetical protein